MTLYMLHALYFSNSPEQTKLVLPMQRYGVSLSMKQNSTDHILHTRVLRYFVWMHPPKRQRPLSSPWNSVYEAFALASFYMLLCTYTSPDMVNQAESFDSLTIQNGKMAGTKWFNVSALVRRSICIHQLTLNLAYRANGFPVHTSGFDISPRG